MEKATFPYLTKNRPSQLRIIQCILPKISEENLNKPLICLRGTTILCFACYLGKEDTVKLLLSDNRVNVDAFDCKGATALMYAVREGHHSIVKLLVQQGAKSDRTNLEGFSSLQYSRKSVLITMELECALIRHRINNASDQYEYIDYAQQLNRAVEAKLAKISQIDSEQSPQNQPRTLELIPGEDHLKL
ncbi:ankyrin, partial [Conidiobolus coronatus NRRL 28638]